MPHQDLKAVHQIKMPAAHVQLLDRLQPSAFDLQTVGRAFCLNTHLSLILLRHHPLS